MNKEATKEERFKLQNARKITESLQKHLLEDDETVRKQLKKMSSCSDFEEVDIEKFEEIIRESSNGRHSSDSFAGNFLKIERFIVSYLQFLDRMIRIASKEQVQVANQLKILAIEFLRISTICLKNKSMTFTRKISGYEIL